MDNQNNLLSAALGSLEYLFNLNQHDSTLILTDSYSSPIADAFKLAAAEKGSSVELYEIKNSDRPLNEIPAELEKLLPGKSIVLNIIKAFPEEISFRIKWIFKVEENKKIKMGHMPGITEDMMLRSVNVDFFTMKSTADLLISALKGAELLHITTDAGTDLLIGVKNRIFTGDIGVIAGEMCNLPCGEIYCAPVETKASGVVVFDASIGDIGLLKQPLKVFLHKGRITKFECEDEKLANRVEQLSNVDEEARVIGELGIGVNPGARITGNMLEDEKAIGTAHIAFGNNADFPGGGNNHSQIHRDFLFYTPTIEVSFADGTKKFLIRKGEFCS
jgi:aminopeptidase